MKLLCVADMHLGRVPARLHEELADRVSELGAAAAWSRAVALALEENVAGVLLAGDLVDGGNDFFEAFAQLRDGVQRLTAAGIQVVAVAGNHDPEVLTRLVRVVPQVTLLGAGGAWQVWDLHDPEHGGRFVRLVGWSFPQRWVDESPLADGGLASALEAAASGERPLATIGLLHGDRDQAGSRYAPITGAQLAAAPVDAWLLGHVHKPDVDEEGARGYVGGYLGSLTANDPGEAGPRGAWLVEVGHGGEFRFELARLAPLRWERLELDVTGWESPAEVQTRLIESLEDLGQSLRDEGADPVAVGCRVALIGRTPHRAGLERVLTDDAPGAQLITVAGTHFFVDHVRLEALPELDLGSLSEQDDPVGLLAARIVALRTPGSSLRARLVAAALPRLTELNGRSDYGAGAFAPPTEAEAAALLEEAALRALDALLAQAAGAEADGEAA